MTFRASPLIRPPHELSASQPDFPSCPLACPVLPSGLPPLGPRLEPALRHLLAGSWSSSGQLIPAPLGAASGAGAAPPECSWILVTRCPAPLPQGWNPGLTPQCIPCGGTGLSPQWVPGNHLLNDNGGALPTSSTPAGDPEGRNGNHLSEAQIPRTVWLRRLDLRSEDTDDCGG